MLLQTVFSQSILSPIMPILRGFLGYLELGKKAGYEESQLLTPNGKSVRVNLTGCLL